MSLPASTSAAGHGRASWGREMTQTDAPVTKKRRIGPLVALAAVVGPGLIAGLSDDDPAGITTYSVLGASYGYRLLWVLLVSTVALILRATVETSRTQSNR